MTKDHAEVLRSACPSRLILEQVADKWSVLIMAALWDGPLRFNTIKRSLEGITQKSLTQALRRLERNGIVARHVLPVSPIAVEYSVTPLGQTLRVPFQALHAWTLAYMPQITQAQQDFDQRFAQSSVSANAVDELRIPSGTADIGKAWQDQHYATGNAST